MFDENRKIKKTVSKLYKSVDPNIKKIVFPRGEREFLFAVLLMNEHLARSESELPELISTYASAYALYQKTSDIIRCLDFLKKDYDYDFCREIMAIVAITNKTDSFNIDEIFKHNNYMHDGRNMVQEAFAQAKRLELMNTLFSESGNDFSDVEVKQYTYLYHIIRMLVHYKLSYREIHQVFNSLIDTMKNKSQGLLVAMEKAESNLETICYGAKFLIAYERGEMLVCLWHGVDNSGAPIIPLNFSLDDIREEIKNDFESCKHIFSDGFRFDPSEKEKLEELGYEVDESRIMHMDGFNRETGRPFIKNVYEVKASEIDGDGTNDKVYRYSSPPDEYLEIASVIPQGEKKEITYETPCEISDTEEKVKELFESHGLDGNDYIYRGYASIFDLAREGMEDVFSNEDMFEIVDFLGEVADQNVPQFQAIIEKWDMKRALVRSLEFFEKTRGQFSLKKKKLLAFAIYHAYFIQVYDEQDDKILPGIADFESPEVLQKLFEEEMEACELSYEIDSKSNSEKAFGYSQNNPVQTASVANAYAYLDMLHVPGRNLSYERIGSFSGPNGIIDGYTITVSATNENDEEEYTIYIDPYSIENSDEAPEGFELLNSQDDNINENADKNDGHLDIEDVYANIDLYAYDFVHDGPLQNIEEKDLGKAYNYAVAVLDYMNWVVLRYGNAVADIFKRERNELEKETAKESIKQFEEIQRQFDEIVTEYNENHDDTTFEDFAELCAGEVVKMLMIGKLSPQGIKLATEKNGTEILKGYYNNTLSDDDFCDGFMENIENVCRLMADFLTEKTNDYREMTIPPELSETEEYEGSDESFPYLKEIDLPISLFLIGNPFNTIGEGNDLIAHFGILGGATVALCPEKGPLDYNSDELVRNTLKGYLDENDGNFGTLFEASSRFFIGTAMTSKHLSEIARTQNDGTEREKLLMIAANTLAMIHRSLSDDNTVPINNLETENIFEYTKHLAVEGAENDVYGKDILIMRQFFEKIISEIK